jgi:hypothetical protein
VFNYTYGTLNEEGILQQAILDFKSFLTSNIAECPTFFWQLNSTETRILYAESDIMLDETLNQINVSMSENIHKEIILWSKTNAFRDNFKTFTVNVCGGQDITLADDEPASFVLNLNPGETSSLAKLSEIGNLTEWFIKTDDLCGWTEFSLKSLPTRRRLSDTDLFEDFTNDMITLDAEAFDITVKTDAFLEVNFYMKAFSLGGPSNAKEINIFICGQEKVSTNGGADKILKSWDDDTVYNISAKTVKASFTSSEPVRCPVVSYHLTYDLAEEEAEPKIALSGN